jgi:hypothetical protein
MIARGCSLRATLEEALTVISWISVSMEGHSFNDRMMEG